MITKIPYKLILIIPTILIGILIYCVSDLEDPVSFYGPTCILISAIAAITVATVTIKSNRHTFMQTNSLAFQQALQGDEHYKKALKGISKAMSNRLDKPLIFYANSENIKTDEDKQTLEDIRYVLNIWERAATACVNDIYDEFYLYKTYKSMVLDIGIQFRWFIQEVQDNRDNPDIYKYFSNLVFLWTIRRGDFTSDQTQESLKSVYKQLKTIETGKLPKRRHKLKNFR
ncbi:DUF4760 domain-containing protein [Pseudoalteromonas sp. 2CM39R]|uniref:DUF4760 domain-containing protein n=1 Tax=Pseudoalteromonas sp. 2CM39R TaxID=2929856 RepID=UPI0020C15537|nr:DUF4760 domain-containing protein [Pseudoalteromonas sp. 2CM39R]MCK8127233.1 DUF4760 domain-containing protein [Pseudoalteromonas sp. 2CM39R]